MSSSARFVAWALLVMLPVLAHAETPARPQRVMEVVSVKIERLHQGTHSHRITAVGRVTSAGWTGARLRAVRERHPNNAVAGFEMVAVPPRNPAAQVVSEVTAALETTMGAVQHTLVVRGRRKSVECTIQEPVTCE